MTGERIEVGLEPIQYAMERLRWDLQRRLSEKGRLSYASRHETLGIITEEFLELVEAVKSGVGIDVESELLDIAVGCIFGVASFRAGAYK